ncbi:MAG TPA: ABC transporter permease [Sandaracinaceae bacterium]
MTALGQGLLNQLRVVHALALRETRTRFGKHQLGYLWALLEPLFWILTFYGMLTLAGRTAGPMELVPFLATGIITYELVMKTSDRASLAIDANRALLFYPQVHTLDLILARAGLEVATYVTVFLVIVGAHGAIAGEFEIDSVLRTMMGLGLAGLLGLSLGTLLCSLSVISSSVERVKGPLMRPLFWISGLFFTAEALPTSVREIFLWNPILHCVEIVRDGWFPAYHARHASPAYVLVWIVVLAFAGLTLERAVRHRIQPT